MDCLSQQSSSANLFIRSARSPYWVNSSMAEFKLQLTNSRLAANLAFAPKAACLSPFPFFFSVGLQQSIDKDLQIYHVSSTGSEIVTWLAFFTFPSNILRSSCNFLGNRDIRAYRCRSSSISKSKRICTSIMVDKNILAYADKGLRVRAFT